MLKLNITRRLALVAPLILTPLATACPEGRRPIGSTCDDDTECVSGLCAANVCLDPLGDEDNDTLINRLEASLGSDPFDPDSDDDGIDDATELGDPQNPRDTDGDGIPDILESSTADRDNDCIPDQLDPENDIPDPTGCGNSGDTSGGDTTAADTTPDIAVIDAAIPETSAPIDAVGDVDVESDDTHNPGPDIVEPTSRCTTPSVAVESAARLELSLPQLVGTGSDPTWLIFQKFSRNHYAMAFDGTSWSTPELFMTGYDMNPNSHPDICQRNGIITACRAETVDSGGNGVLAIHRVGGIGWLPPFPVDSIGRMSASHAILDNRRVVSLVTRDYNRILELVQWSAEGGVGTPTELTQYADDQAFDTSLVLNGVGDGAAIAFISAGTKLHGHPIIAAAKAGKNATLVPTSTDSIASEFRTAQLPDGGVVVVYTENFRRIMLSVLTQTDGNASFSPPETVYGAESSTMRVVTTPSGDIFVAYTTAGTDYVRRRTPDGTWEDAVSIGPTTGYGPGLVVAGDGSLWIGTWESTSNRIRILRAQPGTSSLTPILEYSRPEGVFSQSRLVAARSPTGGVMFVWQTTDSDGTGAVWTQCN